jgi:hypothetical protein
MSVARGSGEAKTLARLKLAPDERSGTRDNLLPEEAMRTVLAKEAQLSAEDAFGLLGYFGAESAGSLVGVDLEERHLRQIILKLRERQALLSDKHGKTVDFLLRRSAAITLSEI